MGTSSIRLHCLAVCLLFFTVARFGWSSAADSQRSGPAKVTLRVEKIPGAGSGGAVLDLGAKGGFDSLWATCPNVIFDGKLYLMWYSSLYDSHMGRGGIGLATSSDGIHWSRANQGEAVLSPGPSGAFDDGQVMGPFVLHENGVYRMWYTGMNTHWHSSGIGFYRIGLATSPDGIHWTRANQGRPVLNVGPADANDEVQVATPSILREGGGYRMWYAAWSPKTGHTLCAARSRDGVTWNREDGGRSLTGLLPGGQYGPTVAHISSGYLMLYVKASGSDARGLFAATSKDGRQWTSLSDSAAIAPGEPPAFDSDLALHACLLKAGDHFKVWYTGYRREAGGPYGWKLRIGAASIFVDN
jgi:predicted GH43/DUF377 family glycosyl hydrolase